tara:strand:- start:509 stop:787 length:279 start_codon:yes stop_codon:yes gene_type:complete
MARGGDVKQECQICGFEYRRSLLRLNTSGLLVCPEDYEGTYDYKSHPQNKSPVLREEPWIRNARPESNTDRNLDWEKANTNWEDTDKYWNLI